MMKRLYKVSNNIPDIELIDIHDAILSGISDLLKAKGFNREQINSIMPDIESALSVRQVYDAIGSVVNACIQPEPNEDINDYDLSKIDPEHY